MDREEVVAALRRLADGRDPATGEPLDGLRPLQEPSVIRTLFHALLHLETSPPRKNRAAINAERNLPARSFTPWSSEDDAKLLERFSAGQALPALAADLQRTEGSIQARLVRLGLIADPGAAPPAAGVRTSPIGPLRT
ncbi:MAG: hypothetical protein JXQ29_17035 [Planctomycetes bacterium]|nr:hypothetical protein [Planctomycetota bacterium]